MIYWQLHFVMAACTIYGSLIIICLLLSKDTQSQREKLTFSFFILRGLP